MSELTRDELMNLAQKEDIGLIYSRSELSQYLVELLSAKKTEYIHQGTDIATFHSVDEAFRMAQGRGAKIVYLCMDNTYDECGSTDTHQSFSYVPMSPKRTN